MAGRKKLINNTGNDLEVKLVIRKGDHPDQTAGTKNVNLPAPTKENEDNFKWVEYGDDINIYLNGLEVSILIGKNEVKLKNIVAERGKMLDNELNTKDTIEFSYDDTTHSIFIATSNSTDETHMMIDEKPGA